MSPVSPKLDYGIGRSVVSSKTDANKNFRITLEGDFSIVIEKFFSRPKKLPDMAGLVFMRPIYSADQTRMQFGKLVREMGQPDRMEVVHEVAAIPQDYRVTDARFDGTTYPQRSEESEVYDLPPDPSPERAADGPEEPQDE